MYKALPIYPSQLPDFKIKAKKFALIIEEISGHPPLSAFQRNDWLAHCLGYTGHSELVHRAKNRGFLDKNTQLVIFSNRRHITDKIISIYSSNLSNVDQHHIKSAIQAMANDERKERLNLRNNLHSPKQLPIIDNSTLKVIAHALNKSHDPKLFCIYLLILKSGIRLSELLHIKLDDIKNDSIIVKEVKATTLNSKVKYKLKLSNIEKDAIYKIVKNSPNSTYLFQSNIKKEIKPLHPSTVSKSFRKVGGELGIELTPSILRQTYYYQLLNSERNNTESLKPLNHIQTPLTKYYIDHFKDK
ncbi:tyrosine-type recombinase/integrase [Vibrio parahaemolyticus]|nr:tyrosine-type recombinase/integrase [Vibrio parahaemolyticus]MDF5053009.1 tyrosine-type recombinase/integrase [Vibrio parahaemolyticus]MDF5105232.1 tyrosine-type recombinase/integrase [Vibrio parahaemolyticus]MDF5140138.1 tyrosine-type recombinase/integrase [Vibrio parahaemolyticus]MDF5150877.1 tyrosine-type recombinase/integrase [Vibrio parahaemolyticus]